MKAYKVVEKRTRLSSNIAITKVEGIVLPKQDLSFKYLKQTYNGYVNRYRKGAVINAVPETPGICCFKERQDAKIFMNRYRLNNSCTIIEVEGEKEIPWGVYDLYCNWASLYKLGQDQSSKYKYPIQGFIGFESVTVLG